MQSRYPGRRRSWALVLVALAAFVAGLAVGERREEKARGNPRADGTRPQPPHPRALTR
jgi:hypothetical protein